MNDHSILQRLEASGQPAPRIALSGSDRPPISPDAQRYEFLGELARGGVGVVHKGHDNDLGRDVAIKVLHDEHLADKELLQRFVEEAQIGGQLQHPGIVPVYELGLDQAQRPFFAMKLVKGETLHKRLDDRRAPSADLRALVTAFRDVCRTMSYAHVRGVIHRDLKPSNVMIGSFGEVQVVDWGLAKVLARGGVADERLKKKAQRDVTMIATVRSSHGGSASLVGSVMGTPAYMPPEQAMGRVDDLDERSDVFSLGAILCEILTGQPPYQGNGRDVLVAAQQAALDDAHRLLDVCGADAELTALCRQCLEPLPKNRPSHAGPVADAVAAWLIEVEGRAQQSELDQIEADAAAEEQRRSRRQGRRVAVAVLAIAVLATTTLLVVNQTRSATDRARREAIATATEDATRLLAAGQWDGALAAIERAAAFDAEADVLAQLRAAALAGQERDRRAAEDATFLADLEEIRGRLGSAVEVEVVETLDHASAADGRDGTRTSTRGMATDAYSVQDHRATDRAYAAAFARYSGSVAASVERLRASPSAAAFAANLGFWCWLRKSQLQQGDWQELDRAARAIDPGHADVRDALVAGDAEALLSIAAERGDELPLALAAQVGLALSQGKRPEAAIAFLQRQYLRAPDDFWLNMRLGYAAQEHRRYPLAARHYTSAVALRPLQVEAWQQLGTALSQTGDHPDAIAACHQATALAPDSADARVCLGNALRRQQDFDGATAAYREAIRLDPGHVAAHNALGACLCDDLSDYDGAIASFREVIRLDPENAWAHTNLGTAHQFKGEIDEALAEYRRAVAADPDQALAHNNLGTLLADRGEVTAAIREYEQAIELDPRDAVAPSNLGLQLRDLGDSDGAIRAWRRAIGLDPTYVRAFVNLGWALIERGDLVEAVTLLERAIELDPRHVLAHNGLGVARRQSGDLDGAIREFEAATRLAPRFAPALGNLGRALSAAGDRAGALEVFRAMRGLHPDVALFQAELALLLAQHGDLEAAIPLFRQSIALEPHNLSTHYNLLVTLGLSGDRAGLIAAYRHAIQFDPEGLRDHGSLGRMLRDAGGREEAITEFRLAARRDRLNPIWENWLGIALQETGDFDGAVAAYRRAVTIDPEFLEAHSNLGVVLANELGDYEAAGRAFAESIRIAPTAIDHCNLGITRGRLGDFDGAVAACRAALAVASNHANAHHILGDNHRDKGEAELAIAAYRRALELARSGEDSRPADFDTERQARAQQALAELERELELAPALARLLAGESVELSAADGVVMAAALRHRRHFAQSARTYAEAFAQDASLADDLEARHRSHAASSAAAADEAWHARALIWLRADLAQSRAQLEVDRRKVRHRLVRWRHAYQLAAIRDVPDLPEPFAQFWADVDALIAEASK